MRLYKVEDIRAAIGICETSRDTSQGIALYNTIQLTKISTPKMLQNFAKVLEYKE